MASRAERIEAVDNRLDMAFKTLEKVCEAVEVDRIGDTPAPPWFAGLCMALGLIEQARTALAAPAERQGGDGPAIGTHARLRCPRKECRHEWHGEVGFYVYCPRCRCSLTINGPEVVRILPTHPPAAGKEAQAQPATSGATPETSPGDKPHALGAEAVRALAREAYSVGYSAGCAGSPSSTRASDLKMLDGRVDALPPAPPERKVGVLTLSDAQGAVRSAFNVASTYQNRQPTLDECCKFLEIEAKARLAAAEARARAAEAQRDDAKQSGDQSWRGFQQVCFAMTGTSDVVSFMDALKSHSTAEAYAKDLRSKRAEAEAAAATAKVAADLFRERAEKAEARAERAVGMLREARDALESADSAESRSMYERDIDCDFRRDCDQSKRCRRVEALGGGPISCIVRPALARIAALLKEVAGA